LQTEFYWRRVSGAGKTGVCTVKSAFIVANYKPEGVIPILMQPYRFNDVKKHSVILVYKSTPPKRSAIDRDVTVQTVSAHLPVKKCFRLTNEITDYKIVALEFKFICNI
jgi:hypothetical protein